MRIPPGFNTVTPYDDRQGGVKDPCGNLWRLSARLVDRPY